ncbi:MAG TPA: RDD family protein [Polyangia bacterium]
MEPDREMEVRVGFPPQEMRVGFLPRAAAYALDVVAVSTLALILQKPLAGLFPGAVAEMIQEQTSRAGAETMTPFLEWTARLGVASALVAPFYGLLEALRGFSPGKLVIRLRIVTEQGQRPPVGTLLMRYGIKAAAAVITFVAIVSGTKSLHVLAQAAGWATMVGFLLVFMPTRTAMHDRIAGTVVMRKSDLTRAPGAGTDRPST